MAKQASAAQEWRQHWGLVLAATLGMSLLAMPSVTVGLFMQPLGDEFGWSRGAISAGMTIYALLGTPLVPFAGALADRFGSRPVLIPGVVLNATAFAAYGLISSSIWQWYLCWVGYTLTQLLIRSPIWNRAVSAAFAASRGLALAVMMAGISLAQVLTPIITSRLIDDHGWRNAYFILAAVWGGVTLLTTLLLFREARPDARTTSDNGEEPTAAGGLMLAEALRDPKMLRIAFAILIQSIVWTGFLTHLFPLLTDAGLSEQDAAFITGLVGVAALAGQLLTGWLADRVGGSLLPVSSFLMAGIGYLVVLQGRGAETPLALGVLIAGYGSGAAINITTYLTTRYAGVRHFGKIFGIISSCMGLGAGLGPLIAGKVYDFTGGYTPYLVLGIVAACLAALAVLRLGPYREFAPEPAPA